MFTHRSRSLDSIQHPGAKKSLLFDRSRGARPQSRPAPHLEILSLRESLLRVLPAWFPLLAYCVRFQSDSSVRASSPLILCALPVWANDIVRFERKQKVPLSSHETHVIPCLYSHRLIYGWTPFLWWIPGGRRPTGNGGFGGRSPPTSYNIIIYMIYNII